MGTTGQECRITGIYENHCDGERVALRGGETFPPCPRCRGRAIWALIQAT